MKSQAPEDGLAGTTSGERYLESRYGDAYWTDFYSGEQPIIFGHHVVGDEVKVWNDRVFGIDTRACHGGRLTALVLPEFRIVQVDGARDYWIEQKRLWQPAVLRAKPWSTLSIDAIDRELASADRSDDPALEVVAAAVRRWLAELSEAQSRIAESIDATVNELLGEYGEAGFARAAAAHPAVGWLFRHRRDPVGPAEALLSTRSCHGFASSALVTFVRRETTSP